MRRFASVLLALFIGLFGQPARADLIKQSTTYARMVYMQDSTTARSPGVGGLTLTIVASKAAGAFAAITPTVTDLGGGWYALAYTTTHTNTFGAFALKITAAGADETDTLDQIVAFDPADVSLLGLTGIGTLANQTSLNTKIGSPAGASVSADVAAVKASVGTPQQSGVAVTLPATAPAGFLPGNAFVTGVLPTNFGSLAINNSGQVNLNLGQSLDTSVLPLTASSANSLGNALWSALTGQGVVKVTIVGSTLSVFDVSGNTLIRSFTLSPVPAANSSKN